MRISLLLCIFTCLGVFLLSGCSSTDLGLNQNSNEVGRVNSNVANDDDPVENESGKNIENWSKQSIREFSRKLRLVPLTNAVQSRDFEFRLWINLGMPGDEKLLTISSNGSENHASFFHLNTNVNDPGFRKERPATPKSGWNALLPEIRNRLVTPKRLVPDPKFDLDRHEGVIFLEVVENGEYQFVFYGHHTSFDDGVRLINLCEFLSGELDVDLDCRGEHTRLGPIS